jgi:hypothetical protein
MAVIMVSLLVQDRIRVMHPTDGVTTVQEHLSESALKAHLIVTPDGDPDLEQLGVVHLHIEAQPQSLPAMTPLATVEFLRRALSRMLAVRDSPAA